MRSFFAHPRFPALVGMTFAVLTAICLLALGGVLHFKGRGDHRITACANNLSQLWKMQWVYASQFGGPHHQMPTATGSSYWKALTTTQPPLIDESMNDIFLCPVKGSSV